MGQKVNPVGFRLGIASDWNSKWFASKGLYAQNLFNDIKVREFLKKKLKQASVSRIEIKRPAKKAHITIHTARPGVVIGKKGEDIELLKTELRKLLGVNAVHVNIEEIRKPEVDAQLVADSIAQQLERRVSCRKALKQSVQRAMKSGAKGVRVAVAGRLGGAEMSRREWDREGRVPLHTLRADIDYAQSTARTTYGTIGVKVWVFKGEVVEALPAARMSADATHPYSRLLISSVPKLDPDWLTGLEQDPELVAEFARR